MNAKFFLILFSILMIQGTGRLSAEIPLFSNSIKKEDIVSEVEINGTRILKFATNQSLEDIKKILIKTMGSEWVEVPDKIDSKRKGKLDILGSKAKRPKTLGTARFTNPKHPGIHIHLVIIQIPVKDKIHTALITTMKSR